MKWSAKMLEEVNEIVSYLKKSTMGVMLESFANYYMFKHEKYYTFENYSMNFANEVNDIVDPSNISNGEYKLAFICELIYLRARDKKEKIPKNVYEYFATMIRYCLRKKFIYTAFSSQKMNYGGLYLISLLKEQFKDIPKSNNDEIYFLSYFLIKEIMIDKRDTTLLTSLRCHAENLDISFLNFPCRRSMYEILNTKRTLYLRFLLILTLEIVKTPNILRTTWVDAMVHFFNHESFLTLLNAPLIETIIFLTFYSLNDKA